MDSGHERMETAKASYTTKDTCLRSLGRKFLKTAFVVVLLAAFAQWYLPYKGYHLAAGPGDPGFMNLSQFLREERRRVFGANMNAVGSCTKGQIWDNGMRASRPHWEDSRPHRILLVGDSWTFGQGVHDEQTFAWLLGQMFPSCAFDNTGALGYGPYTAFLAMQDYLPRQRYDMVIYSAINHHLYRDAFFVAGVINSPGNARDIFLQRPNCRLAIPAWGETVPRLVMIPGGCLNWPGDRYLRLINFLKILSIESYMKLDNWRENADNPKYAWGGLLQVVHRKDNAAVRMRLLLEEMNRYARSQNCVFGFVDLQNIYGTLNGYSLFASPCPQNQHVDWRADFPVLEAHYPVNIFKYRELHTIPNDFDHGDHPAAMVHAYYAQTIGDWLTRPEVAGRWIGRCLPVPAETGVRQGKCVVLPQLHPETGLPKEALVD